MHLSNNQEKLLGVSWESYCGSGGGGLMWDTVDDPHELQRLLGEIKFPKTWEKIIFDLIDEMNK